MKVSTKQSPKVVYTLPVNLKVFATNARKAADGLTSNLGTFVQNILRFDAKKAKLPTKERNKASKAFSTIIMDGRPEQSRASLSSIISQVRRAAGYSPKAKASWIAGHYGEFTYKGVLKAHAARNQTVTRFSPKRAAGWFSTRGQILATLKAFDAASK